ncbi:MAG: hypothetical protein RDU89_03730 [bacterium]|nr:hypothetical protein [bacterium]
MNSGYQVTMVRKVRKLPLPGEVLVQPGQRVEPETPVARIDLRPGIPWVLPVGRLLGIESDLLPAAMLRQVGDRVRLREVIAVAQKGIYGRKEYESPTDGVIEDISHRSGRVVIREEFGREEPPISFDVAFEIGCKPRDLPRNMMKKVGDEIKRGQVVAKKGETQAFFTKTALAPISGVITEVNAQTGYVTISRPFKEVIVRAYVSGAVATLLPGRGAVVETPAARIIGAFGVGREGHGRLRVATADVLEPNAITPEDEGAILVAGGPVSRETLRRALECGVRGIIASTAGYLDIVEALGIKVGVGITGQEDIPLTLILTEGFGRLSMRENSFAALRGLEGRLACVNGATQIRAGAIRPEVVVPFPGWDGPLAEETGPEEDLALGQRVRIISEPYFGQMGVVAELPRQPEVLPTEARVPVVVVALADGTPARIPRANVEVF